MSPGALLAFVALHLGQEEPPLPRLELLVRDPLDVYTDADEIWLELYLLAEEEYLQSLYACIQYPTGDSFLTEMTFNPEVLRGPCALQRRRDPCDDPRLPSELDIQIVLDFACEPVRIPQGRIHIGSVRLYLHPPEGPDTYTITAGGCPCRFRPSADADFDPAFSVTTPVASSELLLPIEGHPFIRGDANRDRVVDVSDPVKTLDVLFDGGGEFECPNAADANDDDRIDMSDAIYTLGFLFLGSALPPLPYPEAGYDQRAMNTEHRGCAGL